jgi:hypothetical protein
MAPGNSTEAGVLPKYTFAVADKLFLGMAISLPGIVVGGPGRMVVANQWIGLKMFASLNGVMPAVS